MASEIDLSGEDNETLSRIIFLLSAEMAERKATVDAAKAELARRYAANNNKAPTLSNGLKLNVRPTRRFDPATAQGVLTKAELGKVSLLTPNAALAKEHLAPARYKLTQKEYGLTITVNMVEGEAN